MLRIITAILLLPIYVLADATLISAQNISPNDLDSPDYISIDQGVNQLTDLGFKEQRNLVDEILGAVGDLSLSASLVKHKFDVDGNPAQIGLKAKMNIDRRVYATNLGDIDRNGMPLSPLKSVYTVIDEAKHELQFESEIKTAPVVRIQPLNVYAGIAVKRIYEVDSLEAYRARRSSEENLSEVGVRVENNKDTSGFFKNKSGSLLRSFNKVVDAAEEIFRKGSDYFADEEKTKIFLENVLDPLRLDAEFFRLSAEKIRDSKSVQVGEILTHSVSIRILPAGIKLKKDLAQVEYFAKAYTIIIHSAFKKVSPTEVIAKSILEVRKGREFSASIELFSTGFEPIKWDRHAYNYEMKEFGYKFDLSKQNHIDAFNDIFARRWFSKDLTKLPGAIHDISSIQNPEFMIFTKDKSTPITNIDNKFRAEFLVAGYYSKTFKKLEKIVNTPVDGGEVTEFIGNTGKITRSRVRVGFKNMKENKTVNRQLKSYVRLDNVSSPKAELAFEYLFSDQYTTKFENESYISFLKMAMASNDLVGNSVAMKNIVKVLNERLTSKKDRRDSQYYALRLSVSTEVTNAIFDNPENANNIKYLIGKLLLGDKYSNWSDIVNPRATNLRFPNECRDLVADSNELIFSLSDKVSCFKLSHMAQNIYANFMEISQARDSSERLSILNTFFKNRYFRAYVPLLILQLATIESTNDGQATFKSIDGLLTSGDLGIELVVDGSGLDFPLRLNYDRTNILQRVRLANDFDFTQINEGERRLQAKGAYIRASDRTLEYPNVFVKINSNVNFDSSYKAVATIREYRFAKADKAVMDLSTAALHPVDASSRSVVANKAYSYVFEIPNGNELKLNKGKDYVVAVQVIDQNGNFVTEVLESKFTIK
ncbi:MAG: hypothetical protein KDD37_01250 [Bdellovibrionales bacterium]|nr:hypothetical protein [Bdellovibrionales bacterium]